MKILRKKLTLSKIEYYSTHLSIMNIFLPVKLTPKEIEVLANFMSLEGEIAEDRFGTTARKVVMKKMGIKPGGLGNYFDSLGRKKFLLKDDNGYNIWEALYPELENQGYEFLLVQK